MKKLLIFPLFILIYLAVPYELHKDKVDAQSTMVFDRQGKLIREIVSHEDTFKTNIKLKQVPKKLINFILQAEDKRFYKHYGIDFLSFIRASWQNLKSLKVVSGASTLDQQVVRMKGQIKRSFLTKPWVMMEAIRLNFHHSKNDILEYYLNSLPFGHRVRGIKQAAHYFFNKELINLNTDEIATLAVLPRSPSRLLNKKKLLVKTRNQLLANMKIKPLNSDKVRFDFARRLKSAPHFMRYLLNECHSCQTNGKIETSLDLTLQKELQLIMQANIGNLKSKHVGAGAALVVDNYTGEILSYIGSHDFFADNGGQIDGVSQMRQPGSTLKPFTYALAFQHDHHPSSILFDVETNFNVGAGIYKPKNYSNKFMGPVRASFALANSLNIPALYLADYYSAQYLQSFFESFSFSFPRGSEHYGIGLTLGNAEVNLLQLVRAYTSFPRRGEMIELSPFKNTSKQIRKTQLKAETADLISLILEENHRREHSFGRWNNLNLPFQFSAKTGTSTNFRDNWVVGFNDRFTIGVWVGNFNNQEMGKVSGITGAGKIFFQMALLINEKYPAQVKNYNLAIRKICLLSGELARNDCNETAMEYFTSKNLPKHKCTFHKKTLVRDCRENGDMVNVPIVDISGKSSYWSQYSSIEPVEDQIANFCPFSPKRVQDIDLAKSYIEFKSPVSGAFYAVDPVIPRDQQKLSFEFVTNSKIKNIDWILNDKPIGSSVNEFSWPLEKGKKHLKAKIKTIDGKDIVKEVSFHVL